MRCVEVDFSAEVEIVTLVNLENHPKLACCLGLVRDAMVPWLLPRVTVTAQSAQCAPWLQLRERNNQKGILFLRRETSQGSSASPSSPYGQLLRRVLSETRQN